MQGRPDSESAWLPTGLQAVPIADPNWAYDKDSDAWKRVHLIAFIKEGLTKSRTKEALRLPQTIWNESWKRRKFTQLFWKSSGRH